MPRMYPVSTIFSPQAQFLIAAGSVVFLIAVSLARANTSAPSSKL